jgi:acyl dehydratase
MALPAQHLHRQGRVLAALGGTVLEAALERVGLRDRAPGPPATPGPELTARVEAPAPALVRDYLRFVGGDPGAYRGTVPPHLFPQWCFPLLARTLRGLPYPLLGVMNGGCRLQVNAPLPAVGPYTVRARLEEITDDGRRVVLHQRVITETAAAPRALVADLFAIVKSGGAPSGNGDGSARTSAPARKPPARVPDGARELAFWRLPADAGLRYALLTGDFNPVHWVRRYARALGHRSTILHGFATMARAHEGLTRGLLAGATRGLRAIDVRFTRPLVLPARVGLYVHQDGFAVGDAPGGPAYLTGTFSVEDAAT